MFRQKKHKNRKARIYMACLGTREETWRHRVNVYVREQQKIIVGSVDNETQSSSNTANKYWALTLPDVLTALHLQNVWALGYYHSHFKYMKAEVKRDLVIFPISHGQ